MNVVIELTKEEVKEAISRYLAANPEVSGHVEFNETEGYVLSCILNNDGTAKCWYEPEPF